MEQERILITVRTSPEISTQHLETVCSGGINDQGEWRRLFPVPLRYLAPHQRYKTFDVVTVDLDPGRDGRRETRRPRLSTLQIVEHLDGWAPKCAWINPTIFPSMQCMSEAGATLAPVAVREVIEFIAEPDSKEWTPVQQRKLAQDQLFDKRKPLEKIPYKFRFRWKDEAGEEHLSTILSWETNQTWRAYRNKYADPIQPMREKFLEDLFGPTRRVSFFMGNLAAHRKVFAVCGWFVPPKEEAASGFLW